MTSNKNILSKSPKLSALLADLLTADKIDTKHLEIIETELRELLSQSYNLGHQDGASDQRMSEVKI